MPAVSTIDLANGGLPRRRRCRPDAAAELAYQQQAAALCALIQEIASTSPGTRAVPAQACACCEQLQRAIRQRMGAS
jgi:hypothetical protein